MWHGLFAVLMLGLIIVPAHAQSTSGNVVGTVYDQSGAIIPGATVTAKNTATSAESTTTSTSAGAFRLENLAVGKYDLTITAVGFKKTLISNLDVALNQTVTQNISLAVGEAATTVEVSESAVQIDTTTAQIQQTFNSKEISDLPIASSGQGVLNLALLTPGVATSGSVGAGTGPSVGGQRPRNNNFTVEGIDNNSGAVTGPLVFVPNDAIAEFGVLQNQYSPDFGHSSGGQYNTVIKSGTNQFHGNLFDYFNNKNLNAGDNLDAVSGNPIHPRFDDNRFGGTVGGPIRRNKLFFFADYEYNPIGQASSPGQVFAPTATGLQQLAAIPGINANNLAQLQKYIPAAPSSCAGLSSCPSLLIGTLAEGPLYKVANPTGTAIQVGQLSLAAPLYTNNEYGVGSLDYNLSEKDSMRGRFVLNRQGTIDTASIIPAFFQGTPNNNYLATFSEYHTFSPTVQNEFRFGYNRNSQITPSGNFAFPGLDQFPTFAFNDLSLPLGPDGNAPQFGYQNTYQLTDNINWNKGAHSLRFGFDGVRQISPQAFTQRSRGDYEYTYLSDYLFDFTPDYLAQRSAGDPIYWGNRWLWGFFANDSWKVRPNLTVNIGLRYEYQTVPAAEESQSLNAGSSVPGLINFSSPKAQRDNFMPRVGVAYSPGTSGKTSIRGGFGINYDVLFDNLGLLSLPPQLSTTQDVTGDGGSNFLANGGLPATGPSSGLSVADARANTSGYIPNVHRPMSYQWNIGFQHEFANNYIFETRYLGTRGLDLDVQDQINRTPRVTATSFLPTYLAQPSQATLNSLTTTLASIQAQSDQLPAYDAAGFASPITAYMPYGQSSYHGFANSLTRRFSNGLQFQGSYTWSHAIDNSTADVFSTYTTPRRPQDSQNLSADRSSSALDHRQRLSMEVLYDFQAFKNSNWFMKNIVANWEFAPIYSYQTGTLFTPQSGVDSNLNGDSAPDRTIANPGGNPALGSGVTALTNSAGDTVAYLANNPAAGYIQAGLGAYATGGRNTIHLNPINDIDMTAAKRFNFSEHTNIEFSARAFNIFNHPQYTGGYLNDVGSIGVTGTDQRNFMEPQQALWNQISQVFSSNPRQLTLALKLNF